MDKIKIPIDMEPRLDIFALLILLGIFQGFFLVYFFLNRTNRKIKANVFVGLFVLVMSLNISETFLNYTAYILKIVWINDFSEPMNFLFGPFCYLYVKTSISGKFNKKDFFHFIPFLLYLVYFQFYFFQPWQAKYNSFVWAYHPELDFLKIETAFSADPLSIRRFVNELTFVHLISYSIVASKLVFAEFKSAGISIFKKATEHLSQLRLIIVNTSIIIFIFVFVKLFIGRDLGDYFIASYISIIIYLISFDVIKRSLYFKAPVIIEDESKAKYQKSSLSDEYKRNILDKITLLFETEKYYLNSLVSLPSLAKKIGEGQHHVSQVINELLNQSFFEMIAYYRIEEAKRLLQNHNNQNITIEELAEKVGYNSKSAFNKAFKKQTGLTPSRYRENDLN